MSLSTYYEALQLKIVKERGSGPTSQDGGGRTRPACLSAPTPVGPAAVVARGHFHETSEGPCCTAASTPIQMTQQEQHESVPNSKRRGTQTKSGPRNQNYDQQTSPNGVQYTTARKKQQNIGTSTSTSAPGWNKPGSATQAQVALKGRPSGSGLSSTGFKHRPDRTGEPALWHLNLQRTATTHVSQNPPTRTRNAVTRHS